MAGFFSYSLAGLCFFFIGALESLSPSLSLSLRPLSLLRLRFLFSSSISAAVFFFSAFSFSFSTAAVAALFFLYSISGLLCLFPSPLSSFLSLPLSFTDLILSASFLQEFLLLRYERYDSTGLENRYFDLLLYPVAACFLSTLLCIAWPKSSGPRIARGFALVLHGTWLIQMAFSFFSTAITHGCELHQRSWTTYTIKCRGHATDHRSKGIATLQFNGHLALLVVLAAGMYSIMVGRDGERKLRGEDGLGYCPLSKDYQGIGNSVSQFTLDSDYEEGEIPSAEKKEVIRQDVAVKMPETNGTAVSH